MHRHTNRMATTGTTGAGNLLAAGGTYTVLHNGTVTTATVVPHTGPATAPGYGTPCVVQYGTGATVVVTTGYLLTVLGVAP